MGSRTSRTATPNYVRTTLSLATTMNMQHLDELISPLNPESRSYRPLDDLLQARGPPPVPGARLSLHPPRARGRTPPTRPLGRRELQRRRRVGLPRKAVSATSAGRRDQAAAPRRGTCRPRTRSTSSTTRTRSTRSTHARASPGRSSSSPTSSSPTRPTSSTATGAPSPRGGGHARPAEPGIASWTTRTRGSAAFVEGLLALPRTSQPIIILQADEGPWPDRVRRGQGRLRLVDGDRRRSSRSSSGS